MQTVHVHTTSHDYPIHIGAGILCDFSLFAPYIGKKIAIVTNETVAPLYLNQLTDLFKKNNIQYFTIILPDGEQYKNHDSLNQIYDALLTHHADRKTTLIALGGGGNLPTWCTIYPNSNHIIKPSRFICRRQNRHQSPIG